MKDEIKLLIADDHPVMRQGLAMVLGGEHGINVYAQACNGEEAFSQLKEGEFDVVTLDVDMPVLSGLEVAKKMQSEKIKTKIVFLTMYKDEDMFNEAMDLGASGYVLKENAVNDIVNCVKEVSKGGYYISPIISAYLLNRQKKKNEFRENTPQLETLTKSEQNILRLISEDKTSRQIAEQLFISLKTVENHRTNISKKLNLKGAHSLLKYAIQNKSLL